MTATLEPHSRDRVATRLLKASEKHSYDPAVDLDWTQLDLDKPHMPLCRVSLYGTSIWERMSQEQRVRLSQLESVSTARVGLWFEILLMGMLANHAYDEDPGSAHVQYALTEIGDETRHSIMFARYAEIFGGINYKPHPRLHKLAKVFRAIAPSGPSMWAGTIFAEETLDRLQREVMHDESVAPLVRMISRIHVTEEARHVSYARAELARQMQDIGAASKWIHTVLTALADYHVINTLHHPSIYRDLGLDPHECRAAAKANPRYRETRQWMAEKVLAYYDEVGLMNRTARYIYRKALVI